MADHPLGNARIVQIGIVVSDIEAKAKAWADVFAMPVPEVRLTDPLELAPTRYCGEPSPGRAKLAFFHFENLDVELIEPVGGPSTWRDQLEAHGDSVHHIAFRIQAMGDKLAYLETKGVPLVQRGEYKGGRYAYTDGSAALGVVLELLEND